MVSIALPSGAASTSRRIRRSMLVIRGEATARRPVAPPTSTAAHWPPNFLTAAPMLRPPGPSPGNECHPPAPRPGGSQVQDRDPDAGP